MAVPLCVEQVIESNDNVGFWVKGNCCWQVYRIIKSKERNKRNKMTLGEYNFIITVADNDRQNAEEWSTVVAACVKVMGLPPWQKEKFIDEKLHRPPYTYYDYFIERHLYRVSSREVTEYFKLDILLLR